MAKFDVGSVGALEYDFTKIQRPGEAGNGKATYCKGKGFIPEPTDEQIDAYRKAYLAVQMESQGIGQDFIERVQKSKSEEDARAILSEVGSIVDSLPDASTVRSKLTPAIVAICGGSPSEEHITQLPNRALQVFAGWLYGEFNDPNG